MNIFLEIDTMVLILVYLKSYFDPKLAEFKQPWILSEVQSSKNKEIIQRILFQWYQINEKHCLMLNNVIPLFYISPFTCLTSGASKNQDYSGLFCWHLSKSVLLGVSLVFCPIVWGIVWQFFLPINFQPMQALDSEYLQSCFLSEISYSIDIFFTNFKFTKFVFCVFLVDRLYVRVSKLY